MDWLHKRRLLPAAEHVNVSGMHIRDPILVARVLDAITPCQQLRVLLLVNLPYHVLQSADTPRGNSFGALEKARQGGLLLLAQCGDSNHSNNSSRNIARLSHVPLWALGLSISAASELSPAEALPVLERLQLLYHSSGHAVLPAVASLLTLRILRMHLSSASDTVLSFSHIQALCTLRYLEEFHLYHGHAMDSLDSALAQLLAALPALRALTLWLDTSSLQQPFLPVAWHARRLQRLILSGTYSIDAVLRQQAPLPWFPCLEELRVGSWDIPGSESMRYALSVQRPPPHG